MYFEFVTRQLKNASNLDANKAWFVVVDRKTQDEIIRLNTQEQLGNSGEGIDALGDSLGEYAPLTVSLRRAEGLQTDHVSFEFTGGYLRSWRVEVTSDAILIHVDGDRYKELVNDLRFSKDHVGLTDENISILVSDYLLANYQKYAWDNIYK